MDADGNMTGKEIIEWTDPDEYLHLSPSYVKAMLEYVHGLEAQLKEAEEEIRNARYNEYMQGYHDGTTEAIAQLLPGRDAEIAHLREGLGEVVARLHRYAFATGMPHHEVVELRDIARATLDVHPQTNIAEGEISVTPLEYEKCPKCGEEMTWGSDGFYCEYCGWFVEAPVKHEGLVDKPYIS